MRFKTLVFGVLAGIFLISASARSAEILLSQNKGGANTRTFVVKGIVEKIQPDDKIIVIQNEVISNYMDAMTMPFMVKNAADLAGLKIGDKISFQLHVTEADSWIDRIEIFGKQNLTDKVSATLPAQNKKLPAENPAEPSVASATNSLLDYKFTNELDQAVSLNSFRGQALAVTFFYTRCPLPNYCPRLSKNFQEASQKLEAMTDAPTNWHFLSISFDPSFDTPAMLKAYGKNYGYDPAHWSFLTGPAEKIGELARAAGVTYESNNGLINHNFRTLIVDAAGHLQMVFPTSGDLSDQIVNQIIKAAAVTNQPAPR
ncbi:MAG: SCO family protein [Limisphaerales bacterium]